MTRAPQISTHPSIKDGWATLRSLVDRTLHDLAADVERTAAEIGVSTVEFVHALVPDLERLAVAQLRQTRNLQILVVGESTWRAACDRARTRRRLLDSFMTRGEPQIYKVHPKLQALIAHAGARFHLENGDPLTPAERLALGIDVKPPEVDDSIC